MKYTYFIKLSNPCFHLVHVGASLSYILTTFLRRNIYSSHHFTISLTINCDVQCCLTMSVNSAMAIGKIIQILLCTCSVMLIFLITLQSSYFTLIMTLKGKMIKVVKLPHTIRNALSMCCNRTPIIQLGSGLVHITYYSFNQI